MLEISTVDEAVAAIRERGYLNSFLSQRDGWFVAHVVPGGMSEDCAVIETSIADELIGDGLVEEVGRGRDLADPTCHVVWFRLSQEAERIGAAR